ncbi:hypothetical protein RB597_004093 [Gaeumannomyces tritici]
MVVCLLGYSLKKPVSVMPVKIHFSLHTLTPSLPTALFLIGCEVGGTEWDSAQLPARHTPPKTSQGSTRTPASPAPLHRDLAQTKQQPCRRARPRHNTSKRMRRAQQLPWLRRSRIISVRLLSMAMTGFFYTMARPRTSTPMSMLKYDPIVRRKVLFLEQKRKGK